MSKANSHKPSYEELESLCQDLQDKVAKGIIRRQKFIETKNKLDEELNRFKLIEAFGREGLFQDNIQDFGMLTVEYFIQAFEQPHCLMAEYNRKKKVLKFQASFGFQDVALPKRLDFDETYFNSREGKFLHDNPVLNEKFEFLGLVEALISPFFNFNGKFTGLIICGQMENDRMFYDPFRQNDKFPFTVMAHKAGTLLQNFRINTELKNEIKERKKIELQLASQAKDLLRSNAELEEFAYVASHDLKSPLRNIISFAQLLKRRHVAQLDETGKEYLDFIFKGINRFNNIIDDLLQYSRTSRGEIKMEKVALEDVLELVKYNLRIPIQEKNASINNNDLPTLRVNKNQMVQLFQNLISNALKFTRTDHPPQIEIKAKANGTAYIFEVRDNGIGIDHNFNEKIFSLFQRLHSENTFEGTGLGLSICKKIVERHKGKIWVESEGENKGSSFFFTLPKEMDN